MSAQSFSQLSSLGSQLENMIEKSIAQQKKLYHKLITLTGQAICDFEMLHPNDKILAAVSGGKDSLTMLKLLLDRKRSTPFAYEVIAVHVDSSFQRNKKRNELLKELFTKWDVPYEIIPMELELEENSDKPGSSCFWCSWNRRKVLFEAAARLKCSKIALAHHKDDLIETTLMNLFYSGKFSTMLPNQDYFKGEFKMIRPLCYIEERDTRQFAEDAGLSIETCDCPIGEDSHRKKTKDLLAELSKENQSVKANIFEAVMRTIRVEGQGERG